MRRSHLLENHEDTLKRLRFERRAVDLETAGRDLSRFLEERFLGTYSLTMSDLYGYLEICPEGLAYILRETLAKALGKYPVRIDLECLGTRCQITVDLGGEMIDRELLATLSTVAARSGLSLAAEEGVIHLSCPVLESSALTAQALSLEGFYSILSYIFEEI